jgi:hypothetical protein
MTVFQANSRARLMALGVKQLAVTAHFGLHRRREIVDGVGAKRPKAPCADVDSA